MEYGPTGGHGERAPRHVVVAPRTAVVHVPTPDHSTVAPTVPEVNPRDRAATLTPAQVRFTIAHSFMEINSPFVSCKTQILHKSHTLNDKIYRYKS